MRLQPVYTGRVPCPLTWYGREVTGRLEVLCRSVDQDSLGAVAGVCVP